MVVTILLASVTMNLTLDLSVFDSIPMTIVELRTPRKTLENGLINGGF